MPLAAVLPRISTPCGFPYSQCSPDFSGVRGYLPINRLQLSMQSSTQSGCHGIADSYFLCTLKPFPFVLKPLPLDQSMTPRFWLKKPSSDKWFQMQVGETATLACVTGGAEAGWISLLILRLNSVLQVLNTNLWWLILIVNMTGARVIMEQTSVYIRNGVSSLTEGQRATLCVGGTIPLSVVLDCIKTRKWAERQHSALCFLTGAAMWSSVSVSCYSDFPAMMDGTLKLRAKWNTHSSCLCQAVCHNNEKGNQ